MKKIISILGSTGSVGQSVEKIIEKKNFHIVELYEFEYPLKNSMPFHSKKVRVENAILYHIASLPK